MQPGTKTEFRRCGRSKRSATTSGVSLSYFFAFEPAEQKEANQREVIDLLQNLSNEQMMLLKQLLRQFKTK